MSIPDEEIENAILRWTCTFTEISGPVENINSLSDGIALTEVMCEISPEVFERSKVIMEASDNWALKLQNLTYLYQGLETYYSDTLKKVFDKTYVDLLKVSKNEEKEQLYNLSELVLGAAVQCKNKEFYINAILTLDESCQNALMYLIEKILNRCNQDQQTFEEDNIEPPRRDSLFKGSFQGNVAKVDAQVKSLLSKIEELENENHQLGQRVNDLVQDRENIKKKNSELMDELAKKSTDMRELVIEKDVLEKMKEKENEDELKDELKLREYKITELSKFIEELKEQHKIEISTLNEELDEQKKKGLQLSKMEGTLEWYKQKYQEYSKLASQINETENQLITQENRNKEILENNENLMNKMNFWKDKFSAESQKNINLDVELTKKVNDIETLKSEKRRLENVNNHLEQRLHEQEKNIEMLERDLENIKFSSGANVAIDRFLNKFSGQDFHEIIANLEEENKELRNKKSEPQSLDLTNGDQEILKSENDVLRTKCKQVEVDNEHLRKVVAKSEDIKYVEKLTTENQNLKQELEKTRKALDAAKFKAQLEIKAILESHEKEKDLLLESEKEIKEEQIQSPVKEGSSAQDIEKILELETKNNKLQQKISELNRKLSEAQDQEKKEREEIIKENISALKEELSEKVYTISNLNERITEYQKAAQNAQLLESELDKKEIKIRELVDEVDMMLHAVDEVGGKKDEELRILTTALHELAIRNVDLEKEIVALKGGPVKKASLRQSKAN